MSELITTHTFFDGAPIDFYEWEHWMKRREPHKRTVRIAAKGGGWKTLEGLTRKPQWLIREEDDEKRRRAEAEWQSALWAGRARP